jgi:hypothetical protein
MTRRLRQVSDFRHQDVLERVQVRTASADLRLLHFTKSSKAALGSDLTANVPDLVAATYRNVLSSSWNVVGDILGSKGW